MAEKDITERALEEYNDVFADIVNGFLFGGREVVAETNLSDAEPRSMYKADGGPHEQERDVSKYWVSPVGKGIDVRIALMGLENQTDYDGDMPLRVIGYDGAAYRAELAREERYPVVTLVLYFGNHHWGKNRTLYDVVDVPDEFVPFVNDYRINLFEVSFLSDEQISCFKSDFAIVADWFAHRRVNPDYRPANPRAIEHVDELLKLLAAVSGDDRFAEVIEGREKGPRNMCEVLDRVEARGVARGRAEGIAEGRAEGRAEALSQSIRALMENMQWSVEQAMDALGLTLDERASLAEML